METTTDFSLSLTGLSADADVQLLDSTGNYITSSFNLESDPETMSSTLLAGDYYVEIDQYSGDTAYTLNLIA